MKTKKKNGYGLYDMSGNVYEWFWDWNGNISNTTPNTGSASGSDRCIRGGSWGTLAVFTEVARRYGVNPNYRDNTFGFRVVRNAN